MIFGFIAGAVERGQSYRAAQEAWADHAFRPRPLVDTRTRSQAVTLFGKAYAAPFGISPMGGSILAACDADMVLARAAARSGIPFVLSASSLTPLERVASAGGAPWFQAYLPGDDARILAVLKRLEAAAYETLVLTVDVPLLGNRENNVRVGFNMPLKPSLRLGWDIATHPSWLLQWAKTLTLRGMPHFENLDAERGPPIISRSAVRSMTDRDALSWDHVRLIREHWRGTFILKGILRGEDARLAREIGVDGVIVSNHGGRQLDGAIAPLRALPAVVAESGGMTVMLDGGVRRGSDVLKALALGARFVFVGRPFLYAAAIGGETGASSAAMILKEEIARNMALLGLCDLSDIGPDLLSTRRD